jgi:hypothetical protein
LGGSEEISVTMVLIRGGVDARGRLTRGPRAGAVLGDARLLAPAGTHEIWAAGVPYWRRVQARIEESEAADHDTRAYGVERTELFITAASGRTRSPEVSIAIRAGSGWEVPALGIHRNSVEVVAEAVDDPRGGATEGH